MKATKKKIILTVFFALICISVKAQITWKQVEPGVWKGVVGIPEKYSLLDVAGAKPQKEGFTRLPEVNLPALANEVYGCVQDGKVSLRFPLQQKEQIYGFGLNFRTVYQRGRILNLHVDHSNGGNDNGRTHAPVPFYVSTEGYGVLINSARYLTVYVGYGSRKDSPNAPEAKDRNRDKTWQANPYSDAVSILVPASGVEIYLFAGPTPMDVIRRYNLLCGGGTLPPRWGLGFTQRTKTNYTAEEVKKEVDEFERRGFPLDFVGLEPGWQSAAYPCTFEWDRERFPDPAGFVDDMKAKGIRVNLWTNPYVSPKSSIYKEMYPLSASHTVWAGIVPDFGSEKARKLWQSKLEEHVNIGISGYKLDEVDGYDRYLWPDVATFPSGVSAEQMRQTYGSWVQRITTDIYKKCNQRTYGLVRASNAGCNSYPYVLYNDTYKHEHFVTALLTSGFSGVLWTPEVRNSRSAEEWLRRFQTVIFSPMAMLDAWSSGTKPWTYPEVEKQIKDCCMLRMQMMPYWYTEFARYHFDGIPPFRAINLEPGFIPTLGTSRKVKNHNLEENPYLESASSEITDQYMAGEYLLVAPVFAGKKTRKVVLPKGDWYDFYTGEYVGNGEIIQATPGLDRIPVYVKDGAIIPFMEPMLHAPKNGQKVALEIRHYGKADGNYRLYDDDGETYDYEKGVYSWRDIKVTRDSNGDLKGVISKAEKNKPDNYGRITWKFMTKEKK